VSENTKIIVTGASGFLGSEIVSQLQKVDCRIVAITGKKSLLNFGNNSNITKTISTDISDYKILEEIADIETADILIHCAGLAHQFREVSREEFWEINVKGTENICRLAFKLGVKKIVLISAVAVYGQAGKTLIDESFVCQPKGDYAESKRQAEIESIDFCKENKINLIILRPSTIIGEGDKGNTARLITTIYKNKFIWIGNGENKKSLIYKKDVAKAVISILSKKKKSAIEIFNVSAEPVSMKNIVEKICQALNKKSAFFVINEKIPIYIFKVISRLFSNSKIKRSEETVKKWLSDEVFIANKIYKSYGFKAETTLAEAIERQVKFYLINKDKN